MIVDDVYQLDQLSEAENTCLQETAISVRKSILRQIHESGGGHAGGALSSVEIMTVLYFKILKIDPSRPGWDERDRFILSKGHACPVLYSILAMKGFFPEAELKNARHVGCILQGHPDMKKTPGVDMTSGSLGQGFSASVGIALAARLKKMSSRTYVLLGDGELDEGLVWEAAMTASHFKLDSLTAIIDYNKLQVDGDVQKVMSLEPLSDKWRAFNWHVIETNGHDLNKIYISMNMARMVKDRPSVIIAHTLKGKGVSFMEGNYKWHSAHLSKEKLTTALSELGGCVDG